MQGTERWLSSDVQQHPQRVPQQITLWWVQFWSVNRSVFRAQISMFFSPVPVFQWHPGKVLPNCLRPMNQRQITHDPTENMQAGGTSALKWTELVVCSANLFNPQLHAMVEWSRSSQTFDRVCYWSTGFSEKFKDNFPLSSWHLSAFFRHEQTELPEYLSVTLVPKQLLSGINSQKWSVQNQQETY